MPHDLVPTLYRIAECPDLMADACVSDDRSNLIFLSLWGRDTAIQEFLARLSLGNDERGLTEIHLLTDEDARLLVAVNNIDALDKCTTRTFRRTLFGSLVHLWLFDKRCLHPDKSNATAFAILPKGTADHTQRLWRLVQDTCPLPLLDHWCDAVLGLLQSRSMLSPLSLALGPVTGYHLAIDVPALTAALGDLIRTDQLCICAEETTSLKPLRRVA